MKTTITNDQWQVLINIIGAVETGGQVYGQRRYDDYTEAYTNSSAENSITIGAFQEFNSLAKGLLQEILDRYPEVFKAHDNAGIRDDLKKATWTGYNPGKNSDKARAIVAIISTPEGRQIQDERILRQMKQYVEYGEGFGITDVAALFEICNFCHQGGTGAAKRIISKTSRPYTLDNLYQATLSDTGNQVGAYRTRQRKVYEWLKQFVPEKEVEGMTITESATRWMIALAEDNSHGYDQIYRWGERGDYDCSSAVITAWKRAGIPLTCTYTGNMYANMVNSGFKDVTASVNLSTGSGLMRGDVLLNHVHHVAMFIGDGYEVEASINEKGGATGGTPGDQTGREILLRPYRNYPWDAVLRYSANNEKFRPMLRAGDKGEVVMDLQDLLNQNGASLEVDGDFGKLTMAAVMDFQTRHLLGIDGIVGEQTWKELDHQIRKVKKTPGKLRKSPRKSAKCVENLQAGTQVRVYEYVFNESQQKWARVADGWIICDNIE